MIVFGGVAGGAFGSTMVASLIRTLSNTGWMFILVAIVLAIIGVAIVAGRRILNTMGELGAASQAAPAKSLNPDEIGETAKEKRTNAAFEGAVLVFSSRYLLAIVGIVGMYEIVSTIIVDFQFTAMVAHYLEGASIGNHFSLVYAITNCVALVIQLLLTSFVMQRFGVGIALFFLPIAALLGSAGFLIAPILIVGSALNTIDNGFSHSINQSAKEALYVPTTKSEKYRAKAFIDMFVQRFAKSVAVILSLGITMIFVDFSSIRWLSIFTIVVLIGWIATVKYAGKRFDTNSIPKDY